MKGYPKFKLGDKVRFVIDNKEKVGEVYIIDRWGTFFDDSDVSYDIMIDNDQEKCLYKHIREDGVSAVE